VKGIFFSISDKKRAVLASALIFFFLMAASFTSYYLYAAESSSQDELCTEGELSTEEGELSMETENEEDTETEEYTDESDYEEIDDDELISAFYQTEELPGVEFRGTLVFVIDDAGNSFIDLEPFLNFPGAITIAVLPGLPNSIETARRIREAGKELFLHQPMESIGGRNPGPGAIYTGMEMEEIREIINRNLDELWPVAGMNNHEGSRISMDEEIMEIILEICRERDIVYLDSRTTAETRAPEVARRMGINIVQRDVFIDNEQNLQSISNQINIGIARAERQGFAIMIGHTWSALLAAHLIELYPELLEQGYTFSSASQLIYNTEP